MGIVSMSLAAGAASTRGSGADADSHKFGTSTKICELLISSEA